MHMNYMSKHHFGKISDRVAVPPRFSKPTSNGFQISLFVMFILVRTSVQFRFKGSNQTIWFIKHY